MYDSVLVRLLSLLSIMYYIYLVICWSVISALRLFLIPNLNLIPNQQNSYSQQT